MSLQLLLAKLLLCKNNHPVDSYGRALVHMSNFQVSCCTCCVVALYVLARAQIRSGFHSLHRRTHYTAEHHLLPFYTAGQLAFRSDTGKEVFWLLVENRQLINRLGTMLSCELVGTTHLLTIAQFQKPCVLGIKWFQKG